MDKLEEFKKDYARINAEDIYLLLNEINSANIEGLPCIKYLIYLNDGTLVGNIAVRIGHNLNSYYSGNFVYQIYAGFRGMNLAFKALSAIMVVPRYFKMDFVILSAPSDNVPYIRTFEKIGASHVESVTPSRDYAFFYKDMSPRAIYKLVLNESVE